MQINSSQRRPERGSVLFLILLAVVLFAALSYAVTSSMRGGGKNMSSEDVKLKASQILGYTNSIKAAIMRLKMINGYDYVFLTNGNELVGSLFTINSIQYSGKSIGLYNATQLSGVSPFIFSNDFYVDINQINDMTILVIATLRINGVDAGTSRLDEYLFIPGLTDSLCAEINNSLRANPAIQSATTIDGNGYKSLYTKSGGFFRGNSNAFSVNLPNEEGCFLWNAANTFFTPISIQ